MNSYQTDRDDDDGFDMGFDDSEFELPFQRKAKSQIRLQEISREKRAINQADAVTAPPKEVRLRALAVEETELRDELKDLAG